MIVDAHILLSGSSGGREMPTPLPSDNVSLRLVTARAGWLGVSVRLLGNFHVILIPQINVMMMTYKNIINH
jgi:hypothetical protein